MIVKKMIALLLALMLLLPTLGLAEDMTLIGDTEKNTIKLKAEYPANPVIEGMSSTTGLMASGEAYTPILTVLDNAPDAYPHWGVSKADILFQIPNAGSGATKLLALFGDQYPEGAGGARSARATMVPIAAAWNAAFAYAGGPELNDRNSDPGTLMSGLDMYKSSRSYNLLSGYAHRVDFETAPHNSSTHVKQIHEELVEKGVAFEQRPFLFADAPRTDGTAATVITVAHRGNNPKTKINAPSNSTFTYKAEAGGYIRTNSSGDYTDRDNGEVLLFANVIVLRAPLKFSSDYLYFKDQLVGEGVAEIFQNGMYVRGAWKRDSADGRIVFVGPDGEELAMQRGKTFIVVTNEVTEVSYK